MIDDDIRKCTGAASDAFEKLQYGLWNEDGEQTENKKMMFPAPGSSPLFYGCDAWTTYQCHMESLDHFHLQCLQRIMGIKCKI